MEQKRIFSWKKFRRTLLVFQSHGREENCNILSKCSFNLALSELDESILDEKAISEENHSTQSTKSSQSKSPSNVLISESEEEIVIFDRVLANNEVLPLRKNSHSQEKIDNYLSLSTGYVLPNTVLRSESLFSNIDISRIENNSNGEDTYLEVFPEDWSFLKENKQGRFKKILQWFNCCK